METIDALVTFYGLDDATLGWRIKDHYATPEETITEGTHKATSDIGVACLVSHGDDVLTITANWYQNRWELAYHVSDSQEVAWAVVAGVNPEHDTHAAIHVSCPSGATIHCEDL